VLCKVLAQSVCVSIAEWYGLGIELDFGGGTGEDGADGARNVLRFPRVTG
jgi:hypothetical protein